MLTAKLAEAGGCHDNIRSGGVRGDAGSIAGELYAALDLPATRHIIQITQGQVGPELIRLRVWPRRGRGMNLDEGLEHALAGCTSDQG